jgi:hypothetical protein
MNYEIEGQYSYYSPCGKPKLRVTRAVHRETKEKAFWQEHNEDGRWVKGGTKDEIAPYRFSEWGDKKGTLIQGEGEKKMDRLAQEGFAVTTSPGGANSWRKSLAKYYRGKDVIILPDNDGPGKKYAEQVARDVEEYANSIKIVELPGLQEKEDIHDWLDKGGSKEELTELCENAPFWESKIQQENEPNSNVGFQQEPTSKEYNVFFEDRLNSPKRDILSGELMTFVDGTWQPASSRLDILGSYAYDSFLFKKHRLKEHLARFGETKKPELLSIFPSGMAQTDYVKSLKPFICPTAAEKIFTNFFAIGDRGCLSALTIPKNRIALLFFKGHRASARITLLMPSLMVWGSLLQVSQSQQ